MEVSFPITIHSLARQAFVLRDRYPLAKTDIKRHRLRWTGELLPSELSRSYHLRMLYRPRYIPEIRVLNPQLENWSGQAIPHCYGNGCLCLHEPNEWDESMLLADTVIPWAAEWLFFYEIWHATGEWHGGGVWPPPHLPDSPQTRVA